MRTAAPTLIKSVAILSMVTASHAYAEIAWEKNLRAAHAKAQGEGKLLLLHFYADNCTWCERLEEGSFKAPQVSTAIEQNYVPVKIHANSNPKLAEMFKVKKFPTDVIVTTAGKTLEHTVSPQNPDRYVAMLQSAVPSPGASGPEAEVASRSTTTASAEQPKDTAAPPTTPAQPPMPGGATAQLVAARSPSETEAAPFQLPSLQSPDQAASSPTDLTLEMPKQVTESTESNSPANVKRTPSTTSPSTKTVTALEPELPGQPELAMQGFCPVTVITEDKWVEGKPDHGVIHLGKLYLFTSEQHMKTFLADPVPYTPVLNEIDVVRFFEERKIVPGKREWGLKDPIFNRMFFFADEAAMNHFYEQYERYTEPAIQVMEKAVKDANPGS
jgi:protein disulfide-isomerase